MRDSFCLFFDWWGDDHRLCNGWGIWNQKFVTKIIENLVFWNLCGFYVNKRIDSNKKVELLNLWTFPFGNRNRPNFAFKFCMFFIELKQLSNISPQWKKQSWFCSGVQILLKVCQWIKKYFIIIFFFLIKIPNFFLINFFLIIFDQLLKILRSFSFTRNFLNAQFK